MVQGLLTTLQDDIGEVAFIPGTGGVFDNRASGQLVWSRQAAGPCPTLRNSSSSSETASPRAGTWATPTADF